MHLDDVNQLFRLTDSSAGCTIEGACNDANGSAAGLDLLSPGWQTKLVDRKPSPGKGNIEEHTLCAAENRPYLESGTRPATGLLIDKIDPSSVDAPCGSHMPSLGGPLTAAQFACIRSFATTLTSPK